MKRIYLLIVPILFLCGCESFGRGVAEAIVNYDKVKLNRCEIEGFDYSGLDAELAPQQTLKVLMIHGVGTHFPGYSMRIQEHLSNNIGLNVLSRLSKNIYLRDPQNPQTPIGNLRITYWQNRDKTKNMLFYELTWSQITTPDKQIIAFDTTERYSKFRVPFNNMMKDFLDNTLPDPLVYVTDPQGLILKSSQQSLCWMLKSDWKNIPDNRAEVCRISELEVIEKLEKQKQAFITHSLGSKILMDALTAEAENIARIENEPATDAYHRQLIKNLREKELTIFMLANQLPILQIGHPLPKVHNQIGAYCSPHGSKYRQRIFKGINIVAFSDPNDILSYAIPQDFADRYIDSRICPRVTNVSVNVAPEISAFGLGIVNPVAAHTDYDNSPKVINLITHGTAGFDDSSVLKEQCHFVLMEKDNTMR